MMETNTCIGEQIPDLEGDLCWRVIEVFANNATKFQILKKIPLEKKSEFVFKSMPRDF
ncbi:hypothetical protein RchiOBHm_Chr5g0022261 [Rosa chinensis]|uniref:Uncharacterized protein n=1 Tax=Rosa chinensis TaxID=74649 RepID=A0A2P6Q7S3_ROSCH|nr:hypothetical protein RchiOBHm_Chr5g0022261 [Rosa chinensis]